MIQLSRTTFDVATDASGLKEIGRVHNHIVFSERMPSHHKAKKIDWKELFAILHAFMLWHERWKGGNVRLACDNSNVADAINKHSIKGPAIVFFNGYASSPQFTTSKSSLSGSHRRRTW